MPIPTTTETPIAWRVCVQPIPFDRQSKPAPRRSICGSREAAEGKKARQQAHYGAFAVIHVQPVFISRTKRDRKFRSAQDSLTDAGWPLQARKLTP